MTIDRKFTTGPGPQAGQQSIKSLIIPADTISYTLTKGFQGNQGLQGNQGGYGALGIGGVTGNQGAQGNQGNQGAQGSQGNQADGLQGNDGYVGFYNNQGYQGLQGFQGNIGSMLVAYEAISGGYGLDGGNQGLQGSQGSQDAASIGDYGNQSFKGNQGTQGYQGFQNQGYQGFIDHDGYQGNKGLVGPNIWGSQGVQGPQSPNPPIIGLDGFQGNCGLQGNQNTIGATGSIGYIGPLIDPSTKLYFYDDFVGPSLNPIYPSLTNGSISFVNLPQGVIRLSTGSNPNEQIILSISPTSAINNLYCSSTMRPLMQVSITMFGGLSTEDVAIGFVGSSSYTDNDSTIGAYWQLSAASDQKWRAVTSNGITSTVTSSGVNPVYYSSPVTFQSLGITCLGSSVIFSINGVAYAEHTTNIPSSTVKPAIILDNNNSNSKYMFIDFVRLEALRSQV